MRTALGTAFARLRPFHASVVAAAVAAGVAGCGGGGDGGSSGDSAGSSTQPGLLDATFPHPSNRSLRALTQNLRQGPDLTLSVRNLEPGRQRLGFGLFDRGSRQIGDLEVALYVAKGLDETAHGPYRARYEPISVKPAFRGRASTAADVAQAMYVSHLPFGGPGSYLVTAIAKLDRRLVATSPVQVSVTASSRVPGVGDRAILVHTPTVASDDLQRVDFAVALRKRRPIVLVFDTARCRQRICAPVVDEARQVRSELGRRATFVYMDVYRDGVPSRGLRPQATAWRLRGGPFVFAIDRRGVIVARLEGAFSVPELRAAARKALR